MEPPGSSLSRPARRPAASTKTVARGHRLAVYDGGRYPGKASFYPFVFPESTVPIRTKADRGAVLCPVFLDNTLVSLQKEDVPKSTEKED